MEQVMDREARVAGETDLWPGIEPASAPNSLSAGLIVHRTGRLHPELHDEARAFSAELTRYMNDKIGRSIETRLYEEREGDGLHLHWLVHMHNPADYRLLLDMVDHDQDFQQIYEGDRLPERGGGNWERMFVQGSFAETLLLPQHGFAKVALADVSPRSFVPPARHQIAGPISAMIHSGNAGVIILREFRARYESRDLARFFLSQWQAVLNGGLAGLVTCAQYEQIWGHQDRLFLLLHLSEAEDISAVRRFERMDSELRALMTAERVNLRGKKLTWEGLFEPESPSDLILQAVPG